MGKGSDDFAVCRTCSLWRFERESHLIEIMTYGFIWPCLQCGKLAREEPEQSFSVKLSVMEIVPEARDYEYEDSVHNNKVILNI